MMKARTVAPPLSPGWQELISFTTAWAQKKGLLNEVCACPEPQVDTSAFIVEDSPEPPAELQAIYAAREKKQ